MKLNISKTNLEKALAKVVGAAKADSILMILANVLIEAQEDVIKLTSTNLDIRIESTTEAEVIEDGAITVNCRRLFDIIRSFEDEDISLTLDENTLHISCGKSKVKLFGLSAVDYPVSSDIDKITSFTLPGSELALMLQKVEYAVSKTDARRALTGVALQIENGMLYLVATDGKRLAFSEMATEMQKDLEVIIPSFTVGCILKLAGNVDIKIIVAENKIFFDFNGTALVSNLIDEKYINWKRIVPIDLKHSISIPVKEMIQVLKRVAYVLSEKAYFIIMKISENQIEVSAYSSDFGFFDDCIEISGGIDKEIKVNPNYLLDALQASGSEVVEMQMNKDYSPLKLVTTRHTSVIMPMRDKEKNEISNCSEDAIKDTTS
jgi:DNA polymerase III subunit beta